MPKRAAAVLAAFIFMTPAAAQVADLSVDTRYAPDGRTTPGLSNPKVTQANIKETICRPSWVKAAMPRAVFLGRIKARQLKAGGYEQRDPAKYAQDHRIPMSVGGHPRDAKNLWPQPIGIAWNASVKDRLENYVHGEVCAGRMTLVDGQAIFQRDWVDVFKLYCGPEPDAACNPPGTPGVQIEVPQQ